jgi:hypothetical protein
LHKPRRRGASHRLQLALGRTLATVLLSLRSTGSAYAILESEARLAAAALGLDPGLGVLHVDSRTRDSLAWDLMEPVRPRVDAYLLDWLRRGLLRREWFFEQRDGNCRLMGEFAQQLSETAKTWRDAVAPYAERCVKVLWSTVAGASQNRFNATPLTQNRRRAAKGAVTVSGSNPVPAPPAICQQCGKPIKRGTESCSTCSKVNSREALLKAAQKGRIASQQPQVLARLGKTTIPQASRTRLEAGRQPGVAG